MEFKIQDLTPEFYGIQDSRSDPGVSEFFKM